MVCDECGFVHYDNPRIVVGVVASFEDAILLCRRAIEPRTGFWTLPAGYLELNETVADGARREAMEEAGVDARLDRLLAVYDVPRISQVQMIFRATLAHARLAPGPETLEAGLFAWDDIPWPEIAFPSVRWALDHWRAARGTDIFAPFGNPTEGL